MNNPGDNFHFSNKMGNIIFLAAEEVLGRSGLNAIWTLAGLSGQIPEKTQKQSKLDLTFKQFGQFQAALENYYGPQGGRGLALRIGRASFQHGLREYGKLIGLTDLGFRLMPLSARLKIGTNTVADIINKNTDIHIQIDDNGKQILWQIERCPFCWERKTDSCVCQMAIGFLQEALYWVSGGKIFNVEETHCMSQGDDTCTFVIDKTPLS